MYKLALIAVVATLSTGCSQKMSNDKDLFGNPVIKYSEVLENTSQEKSYQKIVNEVLNKSKVSEPDLFKILMSNYYENSFDSNNRNKQLDNDKIINFYSKKYVLSNPLMNQKDLNEIIKISVNEAFINNINYNQIDEYVLDKVYGLSTFKLMSSYNIDYKNMNVSLLEEEYKSHIQTNNTRPLFNIFETSRMLKSINGSGAENYFDNQRERISLKYKRANNQDAMILKELEYTIDMYEKVFVNMKFPSNMVYEKEIKSIYNQQNNVRVNGNPILGVSLN